MKTQPFVFVVVGLALLVLTVCAFHTEAGRQAVHSIHGAVHSVVSHE